MEAVEGGWESKGLPGEVLELWQQGKSQMDKIFCG
jgi:hypothetical protein